MLVGKVPFYITVIGSVGPRVAIVSLDLDKRNGTIPTKEVMPSGCPPH